MPLAAALATLSIAAAAAEAAPMAVNGFVGGPPSGAGGSFVDPTDVTVLHGDGEGVDEDRILVAEAAAGNNRVQRLDANGNFELAWGRDAVRPGAPGDRGRGHEVCRRAASCKAAPAGSGRGELSRPTGVAANPETGDVYVVDSGNRRVQQFGLDGRFIRAWSVDVGTAGDASVAGAIAIGPRPPHDVFVADGATNRVLQFRADGSFLRAWGWGVADREDRFESCAEADRCRAGRMVWGRGTAPPHWPNHIAVDDDGVVYASVFLGDAFDTQQRRTRIERFDSTPAPEGADASGALMSRLEVNEQYSAPGEQTKLITNGATLGLDVDPGSGALLAINNPFGTSKLDVVDHPGAALDARPRPRVSVVDLPFLQNVTGIAAGDGEGERLIYLSSGTLHPKFSRSTFTGCAQADADDDCHGLIVLAGGGRPAAALTGPAGIGPTAWVDADGAARYRLQVSSDGRRWRAAGEARLVAGTAFEPVEPEMRGLRPGSLYRTRLLVTKRTEDGISSTRSNVGLLHVAGR